MVLGGDLTFPLFTQFSLPIWLIIPVLILGIVWMTNLFNFMDGSDGLAAMEAIIILSMGGYFFFMSNAIDFAILSWGLAALVAGFLTWNWPAAIIFMGDSGSCFLGFVIAILALISYKLYSVPIMPWIILTSLFWFDATITLLRRILAREKWTEAHKVHAYQRLIQFGWSHFEVLLGATIINLMLVILAFWSFSDPSVNKLAFSLSIFMLVIAYLVVEIIKPMFRNWHDIKVKKIKEF